MTTTTTTVVLSKGEDVAVVELKADCSKGAALLPGMSAIELDAQGACDMVAWLKSTGWVVLHD